MIQAALALAHLVDGRDLGTAALALLVLVTGLALAWRLAA